MAVGCQTSKCRARCRLIGGKLPGSRGTIAPQDRYRFTPAFLGRAIRRMRSRTVQFRFPFWIPRGGKARKGEEVTCFVLSSPPLLDDRTKRSGCTYSSEVRKPSSLNFSRMFPAKKIRSRCYSRYLFSLVRVFKSFSCLSQRTISRVIMSLFNMSRVRDPLSQREKISQ